MENPRWNDFGGPDDARASGGYDAVPESETLIEIDLHRIVAALRRNLWWIIGIVAACLIIGALITMLIVPRYTAAATVLIEQEVDDLRVAAVGGPHERGLPLGIERVDGGAGVKRVRLKALIVASCKSVAGCKCCSSVFSAARDRSTCSSCKACNRRPLRSTQLV